MSDTIEQLRDDSKYYGEFGRQFLSNSDIKVLLEDPSQYGVPTPDNPAFAGGRLFHQLILEPEKAAKVNCVDVANRNTKKYKDACAEAGVPFMLLCKEQENITRLTDRMLSNLDSSTPSVQTATSMSNPPWVLSWASSSRGRQTSLVPTASLT